MMTKNGKMMTILLEDGSAKQEVIIRSEWLDSIDREVLKADQILIGDCRVREDTFGADGGVRVNVVGYEDEQGNKHARLYTLNMARAIYASSLNLHLRPEHDIDALADLLRPYTQMDGNRIALRLSYANDHALGDLIPDASWRLVLSEDLLDKLVALLGDKAVQARF